VYPPPGHVLCQLHLVFAPAGPSRLRGTMPLTEPLCGADGSVRLSSLAMAADMGAGIAAVQETRPDHTATATMALYLVDRVGPAGVADLDIVLVRAGRNSVVLRVDIRCGGTLAAVGTVSYLRRPLPDGLAPVRPSVDVDLRPGTDPLAVTLPELAGFRPGPDGIAFDLVKPIRNSFGSIQGGMSAVAVEEAALWAAGGGVATSLQLHYLAGAKGGPFLAQPTVLRPATLVEVDLIDVPADRSLVTGTVTVEPA
jgi:acyl-coenzyme A thioesterase PaaI-like protein